MAHIHDKPNQHDLTVSMYIIRTEFDQPKLMLHWHKKLNTWLQYGGHVELDENPWQAVEHELLEETGYELGQLKLLQPDDRLDKARGTDVHPQPFNINTHKVGNDHFHISIDYGFVTDQKPLHEVAEDESTKVLLVNREELAELSSDEIFDNTRDLCAYFFDKIFPNWERVDTDVV